jgi:hAT family C-terminal dimerisation region
MGSMLATRALRIMDTKLVVHPLHIAALLLHPLFKTLSSMFYEDRERDQAKSEGLEILKAAMMETRSAKSMGLKQRENVRRIEETRTSCRTRSNINGRNFVEESFSLTDLFEEPGTEPNCPVDDELQRYFNCSVSENDRELLQPDDKFALVKYWLRKDSTFSCMTEAAVRILAIPATQCSSERNFSAAELAQPSKSSRLSPETLDCILYLRSKSLAST